MEKLFIRRGVNDCKIVIPENAHIVEETAAEELVNYIEKALSVKLPVVSEKDASGKCIYVGHTEYAKRNGVLGKSNENWIIKRLDGNLVLTGGLKPSDRGLMYSVYHFLEDVVGVRWWTPREEDVLSLETLEIADDFCKEGTPYFPHRKPLMNFNTGVEGFSFFPKTRTNVISPFDDNLHDGPYTPEVRKFGEIQWYGRPHHCHVMGKYFPADEYYDEHPDWWAWNEEKQEHIRKGHYCFSNEEFFNALLNKLLGFIKEDVELSEKTGVELPYYYSLSLDDLDADYFFCQCPKCKKILEESGHSGYVIRFINRIAREVKKVYPWAKFETLAYVIFAIPPKDDTVPDENVVIRLACDRSDMTHGFVSPANRPYLDKLKTWSELCSKKGAELQIWQYMFNLQMNYPMPLVYGLPSFFKAYKEYGVKGFFIEIEKEPSDFHELNVYVLTHLMEDPDCDVEWLITDFTNRYYGKAGPYVKQYLEVLRDAMNRNVVHAYCCCEDSPFNYIDARAAIDGTAALDRATEALGEEAPYRARLNWVRKTFDGVMLNRYFDLKRQAEKMGEKFEYDRAELKARVVAAIEERDTDACKEAGATGARNTLSQDEIDYYTNLPDEEVVLDIPEYFKNVAPENIYQFPMADITKMADTRLRPVFGFWPVEDKETKVPTVLKISYDNCRGSQRDYIMVATSKTAEKPKAINLSLYQDDVAVEQLNLYREDFIQGGYHIYKIGSLKDIKNYPDSSLIAYDYGFLSIKISGIAAVWPMEDCDVYLSMKPSGEMYGGKAGEENALFIDRMIVVKTR
ncbi:MAG: DUF4838 domain-containing protein [Oscillospiraceae bacterium]|nr:DUF4838 domain-containing protein [Oscillospiraceae bacterium]